MVRGLPKPHPPSIRYPVFCGIVVLQFLCYPPPEMVTIRFVIQSDELIRESKEGGGIEILLASLP